VVELPIHLATERSRRNLRRVKTLVEQGLSTYEIAERVGLAYSTVRQYARLAGYQRRKRWKFHEIKRVEKMLLEGIPPHEIGRLFGVSADSIRMLRFRYKLRRRRANILWWKTEKQAAKFLEKLGYDVKEIENPNATFDLIAVSGDETLYVDVKLNQFATSRFHLKKMLEDASDGTPIFLVKERPDRWIKLKIEVLE